MWLIPKVTVLVYVINSNNEKRIISKSPHSQRSHAV